MKTKHLLLSLLITCLSMTLFAQNQFRAELTRPDVSSEKILNESISDYTSFAIDQMAIRDFLNTDQSEKTIQLQIGTHQFELILQPHELRAPGFQAIIVTPQGEIDYTDKLKINTYSGHSLRAPEQEVRMTIGDHYFEGFIERGNERFMIMPLVRLTQDTRDQGIYVLHRLKDLLIENYCNEDKGVDLTLPNNPKDKGPKINPNTENNGCGQLSLNTTATSTTTTCNLMQIAADADTEFINNLGGGFLGAITAFGVVFNDIMSSEPMLTPFGVSFQVSRIRLFTGNPADTDPYPDNNTGFPEPGGGTIGNWINNMINAVNTEWGGSAIPNDMVIVFTGVPICNPGTVPGSPCNGGCPNAFTPTATDICDAGVTFAVVGQCVPNFTSVAHEIGHNYDGTHAGGAPCGSGTPPAQPCAVGGAVATIMCPNFCPDRGLAFSGVNAGNVTARIANNGGCLQDTEIGRIDGPEVVCRNSSATYRLVDWNNVAGGGLWTFPNITWFAGPGLSVSSASIYNATYTASSTYFGPSWVEARLQLTNCVVRLRRNVHVNGEPIFDCWDYDICNGGPQFEFITGQLPAGTSLQSINCTNCSGGEFMIDAFSNIIFIETLNPLSNRTYQIQYTITNECGTTTSSININTGNDCDGFWWKNEGGVVKEEQGQIRFGQSDSKSLHDTRLNVVPNPTKADITINFDLLQSSQQSHLRLYDLSGKTVANIINNEVLDKGAHQRIFSLQHLPKGTYLLHLITTDGTFIEKVVKL